MLVVSTHSRPKAAGAKIKTPSTTTAFQHTAARRRLDSEQNHLFGDWRFQHTAARRRLGQLLDGFCQNGDVSTHSRPKAAGPVHYNVGDEIPVSTHSRPKAAGAHHLYIRRAFDSFNTQPPEGGWQAHMKAYEYYEVSTHSRPKAAGIGDGKRGGVAVEVSTHSRPKAAGIWTT